MQPKVLEICAGAGGQALGLEQAGFGHAAAVEIDSTACQTLTMNRPQWRVINDDVRTVDGRDFLDVDLVAGGVPCPPFSVAGKQLGENDERDLFPEALRLIREAKPRAVMLENVAGFAAARFDEYRNSILTQLSRLGYTPDWRVLNASQFGVPQLRPRFILVALRRADFPNFSWPDPAVAPVFVSAAIGDLMASRGWLGAKAWMEKSAGIAPTIVGGSKKHGGPDLGPTRARKRWAELGVEGISLANEPPPKDFPVNEMPRLTTRMVTRIQGFPDNWEFSGKKTAAYRQIGNALPPPVARAVGISIFSALFPAPRSSKTSPAKRIGKAIPFQPPLFR